MTRQSPHPQDSHGSVLDLLRRQLPGSHGLIDDEVVIAIHGAATDQTRHEVRLSVASLEEVYLVKHAAHLEGRRERLCGPGRADQATLLDWAGEAGPRITQAVEDAALIRAIRQRGPRAEAIHLFLWLRVKTRQVLPIATRLAGAARARAMDPEDLCSEFYVRKFNAVLAGFDETVAPFGAYLHRCVDRLLIDVLSRGRGGQNRRSDSRDPPEEDGPPGPDRPPRPPDQPVSPPRASNPNVVQVDDADLLRFANRAVSAACEKLLEEGHPADEMMAFRLHDAWGLTLEKVCQVLAWCGKGRAVTTAWRQIKETRERVRDRLLEDHRDLGHFIRESLGN